jgi:hypothetical protein
MAWASVQPRRRRPRGAALGHPRVPCGANETSRARTRSARTRAPPCPPARVSQALEALQSVYGPESQPACEAQTALGIVLSAVGGPGSPSWREAERLLRGALVRLDARLGPRAAATLAARRSAGGRGLGHGMEGVPQCRGSVERGACGGVCGWGPRRALLRERRPRVVRAGGRRQCDGSCKAVFAVYRVGSTTQVAGGGACRQRPRVRGGGAAAGAAGTD